MPGFSMNESIPNSGLILLVHPLELASQIVLKHICVVKSW